jgi:murein tripeptide amidase MpaA
VEFSSQPPYPYSRYNKIYKCIPCTKIEISRTVLGNKIEAFLINENSNSNVIVVAMARQHPGESVGSWMMEGFVNRLLESQNGFSWVLLPMVNVDGVILGNSRTGVQGYDFNRHWYID